MSSYTVAGRVGRDPEIRYTASGTAVADLSVAVNRGKKQPDGTWLDETTWWNVKAFKNLAEDISTSITKGQLVVVTGRIEISEWEKDGIKRKSITLLADDLGLSVRFASKNSTSTVAAAQAGYDDEPF